MASKPIIRSAEQLHEIIDQWFDDRMKRGPLAHQIDSYNQAFHAKEDLKGRVAALFGEGHAEEPASDSNAAEDEPSKPSKAKKGKSAE